MSVNNTSALKSKEEKKLTPSHQNYNVTYTRINRAEKSTWTKLSIDMPSPNSIDATQFFPLFRPLSPYIKLSNWPCTKHLRVVSVPPSSPMLLTAYASPNPSPSRRGVFMFPWQPADQWLACLEGMADKTRRSELVVGYILLTAHLNIMDSLNWGCSCQCSPYLILKYAQYPKHINIRFWCTWTQF